MTDEATDKASDGALRWLLGSDEPAVRFSQRVIRRLLR